jgi:hypothetical protein
LTHTNGAQRFDSTQALIEQRALLFDHPRLKQQGTNLPSGLDEVNPSCLSNHAGLIGRSQVTHHSTPYVNALTYV